MSQKRFGALICCASNGVMQVDVVKKLIVALQKMGYNLLELCIDDIYKIDDEPYFGYLRGGYTHDEIKEMDSFAREHGVELVPCIQTLAHLDNLVKLPCYEDIVDIDNILLVDEDKTYCLIDKMFRSLANDFSSRMVNIGFDEAQHVGLGSYLQKHGYVNRYELLLRHLNKVTQIAKKYGFTLHMWSDMFFRLGNNGQYSVMDAVIPQEVIDMVPDVELCYWDYYNTDETMYDNMLASHERFNKPLWFACSGWTSHGFAPLNHYALKTIAPAMKQVAKHNVQNVLVTLWGDNGHDCSYFSALPVLFATKKYAEGIFDEDVIKQEFNKTFNLNYDDFMLLDCPNNMDVNADYSKPYSACKAMLFNDCFLGWKDSAIQNVHLANYDQLIANLTQAVKRNQPYKYLFDNAIALCNVLKYKATLGIDTRKAYQSDSKKQLCALVKRYKKTVKALQQFRKTLYNVWLTENKPFGWEIHEVRLGGLISRVQSAMLRLTDYLHGKVSSIPELEQDILPYGNNSVDCNVYKALVSVSQL